MKRFIVFLAVGWAALAPASALAAVPVVSSFTPTSGPVGKSVTVSGSGFSGATAVRFNGTGASFSVTNDSTIATSVPGGATTGKLSVTTPGGTGTSATSFKVKPTLESFAPTGGPVGTSVTISGSAFTGATAVRFNGVSASFGSVVYGSLSATVPAGASTGPISVTTPGGTGTSTASFTVTVPAASVLVSPGSGPPGTPVAVSGSGFGAAEAIDVYFDATPLALAVADGNGGFGGIVIFVPANAAPGPHKVSALGRVTSRAAQTGFAVTAPPAPVTTLTPSSGPPKSRLTVAGSGFGPNESVDLYFDTTDLALVSTNGSGGFSGIKLDVPASALPGEHWVTASGRQSGRSAQTQFLVRTNWASFRNGSNHRGVNAVENVLSPATVPGLDLDWSVPTGGLVSSSPAVSNGVVYVGGYINLNAYDAATGAPLWSAATGDIVESSPAVANGIVYVGSIDSKLYAYNAATGAPVWNTATNEGVSSPAIANGIVYLGSGDAKLYAYNAATGAPLWSAATGDAIGSSPAVANGIVYVGSDDHKLYAFNAASGAPLWNATTGNAVASSPAVANGIVYVASYDGKLYAYNATNGNPLWNATIGAFVYSSPAVANGVVYIGSDDNKLHAFNAASGTPLWSATTGGPVHSSPAVANGVVYVGSYDRKLYAFNAASGAPLWSATTDGFVGSSPAVANGTLYVSSADGSAGKLWAYDLTAPPIPIGRPDPARLVPDRTLTAR
jgi:outer membrane protein assembly factor BamB